MAATRIGTTSTVTPGGQFKFRVGISGTDNRNVILDQVEDITGLKVFVGNGPDAVPSKPEPDTTTPETDDYVWNVPPNLTRVGTSDFASIPPASYVIRVRSSADSSKSASLVVTIADATIAILFEDGTVPDNPLSLSAGEQRDFKAAVQTIAGGNTDVQFTIESGTAGGNINAVTGVYTAPADATTGTDIVKCALASNPSVFALLTINIVGARVVITPPNPQVAASGSIDLDAEVLDRNDQQIHGNEVVWEILDDGGVPDNSGTRGTINATGLYIAPATGGLYRVRATNPQSNARATVDVLVRDVRVVITPATATLTFGGTQQFSAQVLDANDNPIANQSVTWSATGGSISSGGLFTAPNTAGTIEVSATSVATGRIGKVTVLVTGDARIDISASTPDVRIGGTKQFVATVRDALGNVIPGAVVTWSVDGGNANGTINANTGLYTAPNTPGQFTVRANSNSPQASGTFSVVVTDVTVDIVDVSNNSIIAVLLLTGQTFDFNARVLSQSDPSISQTVTWASTGGASINSSGIFTAPGAPGSFTVSATSTAVPSRSDSAAVTVVADGAVLVSFEADEGNPGRHVPGMTIQMPPGAVNSFKGYVSASIGGNVNWTKTGNGTITTAAGNVVRFNSSGTSDGDTVVLTARSVVDGTKLARVTIQIKTGTGDADGTIRRPRR